MITKNRRLAQHKKAERDLLIDSKLQVAKEKRSEIAQESREKNIEHLLKWNKFRENRKEAIYAYLLAKQNKARSAKFMLLYHTK